MIEKNIADVEAVGEAIKRAAKRSGSRTKSAAAAVAGSAVITKPIAKSATLGEEDMEQQIQLEADQYIPYPLEEVAIDFEVQGPSPERDGQVEVLLAACRRETIDSRFFTHAKNDR